MNCTIFSDFQNISEPHTISIQQALERIKNGKSKDRVLAIREKVKNGENYDDDKKLLPCVTFSAAKVKMVINKKDKESYRDDASVIEHSGFFSLDFDRCNVPLKLQQLKTDPYIFAVYLSPSGTGIRALVKCPPSVENHALYYTAFLDRYAELDPTSRNIARICFESYDPDLWVNTQALVWDKRLSEEERRRNKASIANRRGTQVISTAVGMVRASYDGNKHDTLRNAAVLLGGYVATGRVDESEAKRILEDEIKAKNPKDLHSAIQTIHDGIEHGKTRPLVESKKIEKAQQFLRRSDGSYDFLADDDEMTEYELAVINGTLEMGLPTGLNGLNHNWMFKKHHIVWFAGLDNVGKSFFVWYLGVLAARNHGWKILIHSAENGDGQLRKKLKEFYLGKSLKVADDEELTLAQDFYRQHFRIISSRQFHTLEDFLLKCEVLYDEGFQYDVVIAEPFNSFDPPKNIDRYSNTIHSLNMLRVFKENYASVWVCDHVATLAARNKDKKTDFVKAPIKADVESGQMKANKTDDFIILHRVINSPAEDNILQIHVGKVKDVESGGRPTHKDNPVTVRINHDYCGYTCNFIDPIKH